MVRQPFRRFRGGKSRGGRWFGRSAAVGAAGALRRIACVDPLESRTLMAADVMISEFMASNTRTLSDQDGQFSDWIELHNTTAAPVNLQGWHLTDDPLVSDKWTFPSVTLPANGYLVVFASQKDRATAGQELHTNFKLEAGGEYLALFPPEDGAEPATEFDPYPRQLSDISFGVGAPSRVTTALLSPGAPAKYVIPTDASLGQTWTAPDFDDTSWSAGQTGIGYEVTTSVVKPLPQESEPNETSGAANDATGNFSPLVFGAGQGGLYQMALKGTVGTTGDVDFFNIGTLQAGERISITDSGSAGSRGTLGDPYLEVYRLNGGTPVRVTTSDDEGPGNDSFIHRFAVPADDTYFLRAASFTGGTATGTYQLGVVLEDAAGSPAPLTGSNALTEVEPDNTAATAFDASGAWKAVRHVSSTEGAIEPSAVDTDIYRFRFTAGDVVTVTADSTSALDARVALLSSTGTTVLAQDDGQSFSRDEGDVALDSRLLSFSVPTTGNYFVRVQGINATQGSYRLEVDLSTTTPPPTAAWFSGLAATNVQAAMQGVNAGAYVRVPFTIGNDDELANVERLTLGMKYDDGFVAYLNGTEIARRNATGAGAPAFDAAATADRENAVAAVSETIDLSAFKNLLTVGVNVLAVHGMNASAADEDFLVLPEVFATSPVQQQPPGYFNVPTPARANGIINSVGAVGDTQFDHDRGFYDQPFDLAITTDTPGAQIRYTLNGDAPTATNGIVYTGPLRIDKTTTIRAMAFKPGYVSTNIDTQTYIFLDDVIRQSPAGQTPPGWPASWGANRKDYGMDPDVVDNPQYRDTIKNDLTTLPTFSLVMDLDDLFNSTNGIYSHPGNDGREWERPASLELINPDGTKGFQAEAGVRIRGGFSRSTGNPKHAFRFFFRTEYGQSELDYPVFGPDGAKSFKGFDLRTFQNYSWSFDAGGGGSGVFIRDMLSRDLQLAMGQPAERGDYYHLYINGQYWGLYNTDERPEANYGASYFGGKAEDYDVIKVDPDLGYNIEATDGNLDAWTQLYQLLRDGNPATPAIDPVTEATFQRIQGNNPDGTPNPNLPVLLDVDNLIDYMLVIYYGGNLDAPISNFLGNTSPNNFFAMRNRNLDARQGFRFFSHDAEHTLLDVNQNRLGPWSAGNDTVFKSNPQWFFQRLWTLTSFKTQVGDEVQKQMVDPGGALTPEKVREAFLRRKEEIDRAVVGESARWGDAQVASPRTRNATWMAEVNRLLNSYFPQRTNIVLGQLRSKGLYPAFGAPLFNRRGGTVAPGFRLTMAPAPATPAGSVIYYTLDGSDPRLPTGGLNPNAVAYSDGSPVTLNEGTTVKARALSSTGAWSPLANSTFAVDNIPLRVSEIMYHPAAPPAGSAFRRDDFEFIELQNVGTTQLDLSGLRFTDGIDFTFPDGTVLPPGAYAVLVRNAAAFAERYGDDVPIAGTFLNGLNDAGERLVLKSGANPDGTGGVAVIDFSYSDAWEPSTDGSGRSLVNRNPAGNPDALDGPDGWRRSAAPGGSPAAADPALPTTVVGRWVYYNRSGYDGTASTLNAIADSSDDNARAIDKAAMLPGQGRATFANVSTYTKGINGVFVDLADLPPGGPITAADLEFRVGAGGDPATWEAAPAPTVVAVRRGAGVGASDRLSLAWADNAIKNQWLQVTVKANARTGLAAPDVFYFGNLAADTGDAAPGATLLRVNALDLATAKRAATTAPSAKTDRVDVDRDGRISALDLAVIKSNLGHVLQMLDLSAGAAAPAGVAAAGAPAAGAPAPLFSTTPVSALTQNRDQASDLLGRDSAALLA